MIADLKPYPEYKESELAWLGQVPVHWRLLRLKNVSRLIMGQSPSSNQCSTKNIGTPFLQGCAEFGKEHPISNQFCIFPPKICPGGAILLSVRAPVGRLNVADQEYCIGRGLCAVVPFDSVLQRAFVRYALEVGTRGLQQLSTGSTYDAVSIGDISIQPISIPPIDEQASIIRFLDWANERFGRAIQAKQKVISLLREQKQAIILHAVTKGLDPSVSLKPLGIPWLEGIPQHWEIKRAKYIFREVDHRSVDGNEELLSVSHITGVTPRSQKNITMFKAESYAGHKLCSPGDLVINTMWAWAGALGVTSYSGIVSPSYAVYRPYYPEKIVIGYIDELLRTSPYISNIICHSTGLRPSRLRFYPEDFLRLHIIQPPIIEQQAIVESIRVETARFNAAIARLEHEIGLIHEYRTRLDADVVTGKVDVREATARLPIETHDSNEMILDSNELAIPSDLDDKEVEV